MGVGEYCIAQNTGNQVHIDTYQRAAVKDTDVAVQSDDNPCPDTLPKDCGFLCAKNQFVCTKALGAVGITVAKVAQAIALQDYMTAATLLKNLVTALRAYPRCDGIPLQ